MKRDLRKAEEEEKWREKANNRDQWKEITKVVVYSGVTSRQASPVQKERPEEEQDYVRLKYMIDSC